MAREWYQRITVYHYMIAFLTFFGILYIVQFQSYNLLPQLLLTPFIAALLEIAIVKFQGRHTFFPQSAIISGLFAAIILESLWLAVGAAVLAILIKHILRVHGRHIFNPAASGIIVVSIIAGLLGIVNTNPAIWWGASTFLIIPLGLFIAWKIRRLGVALPLLAVYFGLTLLGDIISGGPLSLSILYDLTPIFLALFMAVEPRTTPGTGWKGKVIFGAIVAVLMIVGFYLPILGLTADWFLISLLIMNIFRETLENKL